MYFKILSRSGIHQGSTKLYQKQPIPVTYDRGHLVPVNILRYSDESARATFTYTNCVPQIKGFNRGVWKKYEQKIDIYARRVCSPNGGTLYLITGTSSVQFDEELDNQGEKKITAWRNLSSCSMTTWMQRRRSKFQTQCGRWAVV